MNELIAAYRETNSSITYGGEVISLDPKRVASIRIPKNLKAKFAAEGGVDSPAYKKWVIENWAYREDGGQ